MDFNERVVVDFPKGGFRYQREATKVAKRLKDADLDRVRKPLISLLAGNANFNASIANELLAKLTDTFFILTINANLLAVSIYHLVSTGFFTMEDGKLAINGDFAFDKENYTYEAMKDQLEYIRKTKEYSNIKGEKYEKYAIRTIANIFRYQRYIVKFFMSH